MKKTDEVSAIDIIKKLYRKRTNSGNGISYDPITIVEINLLRSLLKYECKDYHIIKAIIEINNIENVTLKDFTEALKRITSSESIKDHQVKWEIIVPFYINIRKRQLKINGYTIKIVSYSTLKKKYPLSYYHYFKDQILETKKIENRKCKYLLVKVDGFSIFRAWKTIEPTFNLLRGLAEFVVSYNTWTFFSRPKIKADIPHPKFVFGVADKLRPTYIEFAEQEAIPKNLTLNTKQMRSLEKYLKLFQKKPAKNTINDLLADVFRLYCQAMDENNLSYCFLGFWQIAERISLSDPNRPSSEIIKKRLAFFTNSKSDFDLSPYIRRLYVKRCDLVHKGIDEIEETDFNILKSICEFSIVWLYTNRLMYKSINHLETFFSSKDLGNDNINAAIQILNYIKKQRKK
ncbi:MAG TPA: HEPN domain-containing protein [Bacteroidales bacterium]|nr:HEPN domain-containing protein [Bacteroidales bacterium]HOM41393.1 HEPN domain-containing protein [Bacteroidales bacterium]HPP91977.1 HEPN domain-containing protein [Bacteroidales bacterium]HRR15197.1 HEPN domain-containing protein [Bacteroidales bacterium]HRU55606.1 HEPN domain-containing protein [Bacteroidales bacterium]